MKYRDRHPVGVSANEATIYPQFPWQENRPPLPAGYGGTGPLPDRHDEYRSIVTVRQIHSSPAADEHFRVQPSVFVGQPSGPSCRAWAPKSAPMESISEETLQWLSVNWQPLPCSANAFARDSSFTTIASGSVRCSFLMVFSAFSFS